MNNKPKIEKGFLKKLAEQGEKLKVQQAPPESLFDRAAYLIAMDTWGDEVMAQRAGYELGYFNYFGELPDDAWMIEEVVTGIKNPEYPTAVRSVAFYEFPQQD